MIEALSQFAAAWFVASLVTGALVCGFIKWDRSQ